MLRSFDSLALRQLRTRRLRALLTTFGIVLGVGMVFGVLLLVATIRHTFDDLIGSAWGKTDLIVTGEAGKLPESKLDRIRLTDGVDKASPWIGSVFTRLEDGEAIEGPEGRMWVAAYDPAGSEPFDFHFVAGRRLQSGRELIVERNWARDRGIGLNDRIAVATPSGPATLPVVGVFRFSSDLSFGGQGLAVMPLLEARELMEFPRGYTQVSVTADDRGEVKALQARLAAALGGGVKVQTPGQVSDDASQQLDALSVVLYFMSGVALFVGGFLILNSFNMTVLQRMREIGMLRTLGATRGMVTRSVLTEALALGIVGSVLGLGLGLGLALGLMELMRGLDVPVGRLQVPAGSAVVAVLTGLVATTLGALHPARRAGRVEPIRAVLGSGAVRRSASPWRAVAGVALLLPGLILGGDFWFTQTGDALLAAAGIGGTMAMFAGIVLLAPFVITPLIRLMSAPLRGLFPTAGRLASDAARANPGRTAATAAALVIGLSVVVTNAGMSESFLGTIKSQIDRSFARDFTVRPQGIQLEDGGVQTVPARLREQISGLPETRVATPVRSLLLDLPGVGGRGDTGLAVAFEPREYALVDHTEIAGASRESALAGVARGGIIVGRSYAKAADLSVGSRVTLRGPAGTASVPVVGELESITDFGGNTMQMSLRTMRDVYGIEDDAQLLVRARSDAERPALERKIDSIVSNDHPNLELLSTAEVKSDIENEVNQQFAMFNAILVIAVIVSLLGVINTLAMSVMERTREIGVLRALGFSRWQVRRTMLDESLLITLSGAVAGIAFGTLISWVWVRGLGSILPGMSFTFPLAATVMVAIAAVALGVVAAILPAQRAARLNVVDALTYE